MTCDEQSQRDVTIRKTSRFGMFIVRFVSCLYIVQAWHNKDVIKL